MAGLLMSAVSALLLLGISAYSWYGYVFVFPSYMALLFAVISLAGFVVLLVMNIVRYRRRR